MSKAARPITNCVNIQSDPIFAAIGAHRAAEKLYSDANLALDRADAKARKRLGSRPSELVAWRGYHGDVQNMKAARAVALAAPNANPKAIALEYRAALATLRKQIAAAEKWDRRAGVVALRRELDAAIAAEHKAGLRMARTQPRTLAGALALLKHTLADIPAGSVAWHEMALASVLAALGKLACKYELGISRKAFAALARVGKGGAK